MSPAPAWQTPPRCAHLFRFAGSRCAHCVLHRTSRHPRFAASRQLPSSMHTDYSPLRRFSQWLSRWRHRRGYGVHSPWAFSWITQVIYNDMAYYAYADLQRRRRLPATDPEALAGAGCVATLHRQPGSVRKFRPRPFRLGLLLPETSQTALRRGLFLRRKTHKTGKTRPVM